MTLAQDGSCLRCHENAAEAPDGLCPGCRKAPTELLTAERVEEIRRLAEAATPGPWEARSPKDSGTVFIMSRHVRHPNATGELADVAMVSKVTWDYSADSAFITACDPPTLLALLSSHDADRAEIEELRERDEGMQTWAVAACKLHPNLSGEIDKYLKAEHSRARSAEAEASRLRTRVGRLEGEALVERLAFEAMQWVKVPENNPGSDQPSLVFARRFSFLLQQDSARQALSQDVEAG